MPSEQQFFDVLELLHNGLTGQNSQAVQRQLAQYQRSGEFARTLTHILSAHECPVQVDLAAPWSAYRKIAGLTLKNAVGVAKTDLGEDVFVEIGTACLEMVWNEAQQELVGTACAVVVKMTCVVGLQWWAALQVDLSDQVLNQLLASDDAVRVIGALTCIEFFFEDGVDTLGDDIGAILHTITNVVANHPQPRVRSRAFALVHRAYEIGEDYEWNVDVLRPLQVGLNEASMATARCVSAVMAGDARADERLMNTALRAATSLVHFLDTIAKSGPGAANELNTMFGGWVATALEMVAAAGASPDVATQACEFIAHIATVCHRIAGDGALGNLIGHLDNAATLHALVESLFPCMLMKDEEANELAENDSYEKRDLVSTRMALSKKASPRGGDGSGDDLSDDVVLANLRAAASKTLFSICKLNPIDTFPPVLRVLQEHWQSAEWQFREVSMLALGCVANGAYELLQEFLPQLVPQLCDVVEEGDAQNFILAAIALFNIGMFAGWMVQNAPAELTQRAIAAVLGRFCSTSKRVQAAAVSSFRALCTASIAVTGGDEIRTSGSLVVENLCACIPVYHTNNLAQLADLVGDIAFLLVEVPELIPRIEAQLQIKYGDFEASFEERYTRDNSNAFVDTDVFHLASMLASLYEHAAAPDVHVGAVTTQLNVWVDLLQTLLQREITDDAGLIVSPLHLISYFIQCLDTNALTEWHHSRNCVAVDIAISLAAFDSDDVRVSCLDILYRLLCYLSNNTVADPSAMVALLPRLLPMEASNAVALDATSVLGEICKAYGANQTLARMVSVQAAQVRDDAFGTAMDAYSKLACRVGAILRYVTGAVDAEHLSRLANVASFAPNADDKIDGTIGIMAAVGALDSEQAVVTCLHSVVRLVASWQTQAADEVYSAIQGALIFLRDNAGGALQAVLNDLPQSTQAQLLQTYQLA